MQDLIKNSIALPLPFKLFIFFTLLLLVISLIIIYKNPTNSKQSFVSLFVLIFSSILLIGSYGFRPSNPAILQEFSSTFNHRIELTTIHAYGGWDAVYKKFFDEGGVFDEIYGT